MTHSTTRMLAALAAAGGAIGLVACGADRSPTGTEAARTTPAFSVGDPTSATPEAGTLKICKEGNIDGVFTLSVTPVAGGSPIVVGTPVTVTAGTCKVVVTDNDGADVGSSTVITETSDGFVSASAKFLDGSTPAYTTGVTPLFLNQFHGWTVTYVNQASPPEEIPTPLFVIGDVEAHALGDNVNFWGAQWWKNNFMSGFVSNGVASFKGYASDADNFCGGTWLTRPGNSSNPPDVIPDQVAIIVTSTVLKQGPNISGNIKEILLVQQDGGYGPAPGHRGNGPVIQVLCSSDE